MRLEGEVAIAVATLSPEPGAGPAETPTRSGTTGRPHADTDGA